jgi:antitoxin component YwqK of YwqJK toxin-antitoxin module
MDTIQIADNYKSGAPKETGTILKYGFEGNIYELPSGKLLRYYRNEQVCSEIEYNSFGCELCSKYFDLDGILISESKTTKIDIKGDEVIGFLELKNNRLVYTYNKSYLYSTKSNDLYLKSEGNALNGQKIGKWIKYSRSGSTTRVSNYK